jgi:hypothetical protein
LVRCMGTPISITAQEVAGFFNAKGKFEYDN